MNETDRTDALRRMPASIGMPLLPHKRSTTQSRYVELRRVKGFSSVVITGMQKR